MAKNESGSAILEGVAALGVVLAFTSCTLVAAYLLFARAFLQFETEQALLCLAEARPAFICKRKMLSRLESHLPWGRVARATLAAGDDQWRLGVEWEWFGCRLSVRKNLNVRRITGASRS